MQIHLKKQVQVKNKLEKEIIKALEINSKVDLSTVDPSAEFKELKRFVRKCFKDHLNGTD